MTPDPVTFEPVDEGSSSDPAPGVEEDTEAASRQVSKPVREAERDPYPLAGPILEGSRARVLRGRCSSCQARLRLRLAADRTGSVKVRCPICGRTDEVDAP